MRRFASLLTIVLLLAITNLVLSQAPTTPRINFSDTRLANGLRMIAVEDHTAPVIVVAITYNVGSRDERRGRTGFAHLFEHMMFKGSENIGVGGISTWSSTMAEA